MKGENHPAGRVDNVPRKISIVVSGASGFIGSNFVNAVKDDFYIYALARRSQMEAGVPGHSNIQWLRGDIGKKDHVENMIEEIARGGRVDYFFHFAGYYDFTNKDNVEYQRTNIDGSRFLLEGAEKLGVKRFIFTSSVTVTDFLGPNSGRIIDEKSPADAAFPYAVSKRACEELLREHSARFACTVVRAAAIFSDWCEYGPLYVLLKTWLSKSLRIRYIAGKGFTALPYLHVLDLISLFNRIIARHDQLPRFHIVVASQNGSVSHNEIYETAYKYFFGRRGSPVHVPKVLAAAYICMINLLGKFTGEAPFERLWMLRYTDQQMSVDASFTMRQLDWLPSARHHLLRRLLFLVENMKRNSAIWDFKNELMARKSVEDRPSLLIYETMLSCKDEIVGEHVRYLSDPGNRSKFPSYQQLDAKSLRIRVECIYEMFELVLLNGDRPLLLCYTNFLAKQRLKEGFGLDELCDDLLKNSASIESRLRQLPSLQKYQQKIHDEIGLTMQMIIDEVKDVYDSLNR
jgi:nucleoside-diphosphate-sugar epimerase